MATIACHLSKSGITTSQTNTNLAFNSLPDSNLHLTTTGTGLYLSDLSTTPLVACTDTPDLNLKWTVTSTIFLKSYLISIPTWSRYGHTEFIQLITGSDLHLTITGTGLYLSDLSTTQLVACTDTPDLNLKLTVTSTIFLLSYLISIPPEAGTAKLNFCPLI